MAKIYNIHSKTLSESQLQTISDAFDKNQNVFLMNEDFRYEIIDTDRNTVLKSSFLKVFLIPYYAVKKGVNKLRGKR